MELCQGMSIFHHIKKVPDQRLPEDTCKHIFKQLIRAVGYMHQKGYAHRDLKLDNILMDTTTKTIKIIDFGFSLKASGDEKLNVFCGTPHYMDPDIVRKSPYNGPAADIWACGVILYIIFVGKLPFFGEFEADLFRKIQNGKFTAVPADLGDEKIRHLFKRIFEVSPSTRITAQQVSTPLC
jgi:serine/threonine protein kinase